MAGGFAVATLDRRGWSGQIAASASGGAMTVTVGRLELETSRYKTLYSYCQKGNDDHQAEPKTGAESYAEAKELVGEDAHNPELGIDHGLTRDWRSG